MIWMYTGTPGSGKSLHAARSILYASIKGQQVIANFAVRPTKKQLKTGKTPVFWDNTEITPQRLIEYAKKSHKKGLEGQTLLVIDEAQILFNCRAFNEKGRNEWVKFFSLHRHMGYDIILITQYDRSLDRQIRVMAEYEVKHRAINRFGIVGWILSLLRIKLFCAIEKWYGINEVNSREFFLFHRRYANVYDSYANFEEPDLAALPDAGGGGQGAPPPVAVQDAPPAPPESAAPSIT